MPMGLTGNGNPVGEYRAAQGRAALRIPFDSLTLVENQETRNPSRVWPWQNRTIHRTG